MKTNRLILISSLLLLTVLGLASCAPTSSSPDLTAERLTTVSQSIHAMIDQHTYPQGEDFKKRLHGAVELALAANAWQLHVYASSEADIQAAADTERQVVETYFPAAGKAAVLEDMRAAAKWKANPSTATVPPAMLGLELENLGLKNEAILYDMAFMRLNAAAGCETIRTGLNQRQDSIVSLGEVILENTLNAARQKLTDIPAGYPQKLDTFFSRLKEDKLKEKDSLNIQEEELDRWFADLTSMLLQSWSEGQ